MATRYPLEPLTAKLRAQSEAAVRAFAEAIACVEAARQEVGRVELRLSAAREETAALARTERGRLETGAARASDLARVAEVVGVRRLLEQALEAERRAATERLSRAVASSEKARAALADATAAEGSVERHRERWELVRSQQQEASAEDAALETWSAQHSVPGSR